MPEVGTILHARYEGEFYVADVVAVAKGKSRAKAPVKVHFKGWDDADTWVALSDLKCKALGLKGTKEQEAAPKAKAKSEEAPPAKAAAKAASTPVQLPSIGESVKATAADGKVYPAKVIGAKVQVEFSDGTTKWVTPDDIKMKPAKQFDCSECKEKFATEAGRDHHWWDAHVVWCSECGKMFDNATLRDEHWWDSHIWYCKQCGKLCPNIHSLVQHARDAHQYKQDLVDLDKRHSYKLAAATIGKDKQ